MRRSDFRAAVEAGLNGHFAYRINEHSDANFTLFDDKAKVLLSKILVTQGIFNSMLIRPGRRWGADQSAAFVLKEADLLVIKKKQFEYSAIFNYHVNSRNIDLLNISEERVGVNEVDYDDCFKEFERFATSGITLRQIRLTITGDFSSLPKPDDSNIIRNNFIYNIFDRVQYTDMLPNTGSSNALTDCIYPPCEEIYSFSYQIRDAIWICHVEYGDNLELRSLDIGNKVIREDTPYSGWIPSDLGELVIDINNTDLFNLHKLEGKIKITSGDTILKKIIDRRLHLISKSELVHGETNYIVEPGIYFISGKESDYKNCLEYDDWMIALSEKVPLLQGSIKASLLRAMDSIPEYKGGRGSNRQIRLINIEENESHSVSGDASKINKM